MIYFGPFLPFHPTKTLKNQNFKKMKKTPAHIIIWMISSPGDIIIRWVPHLKIVDTRFMLMQP